MLSGEIGIQFAHSIEYTNVQNDIGKCLPPIGEFQEHQNRLQRQLRLFHRIRFYRVSTFIVSSSLHHSVDNGKYVFFLQQVFYIVLHTILDYQFI